MDALHVRVEPALERVTEAVDVMDLGRIGLVGASEHLLERWPVHARAHPFEGHVRRVGRVNLAGVGHRERLGERVAVRRAEPLLVVGDRRVRIAARLDEVGDAADDEVRRQAVEVVLGGVLDPVAPPVVVHTRRHRVVSTVDLVGEDALDPGVLGERHVGPVIECPAAGMAVGLRVTAGVGSLVKLDERSLLLLEAVGGAQGGHA